MDHARSKSMFHEAQQLFPGGVNSPVRAFKSVGGEPIFFARGEGAQWVIIDATFNVPRPDDPQPLFMAGPYRVFRTSI